jgi:drug/metabolite transporter (DMT)-like permease
MAVIGIAI